MSRQLQFPTVVQGAVDQATARHAKADGMATAEAHTGSDWAARCDQAIRVLADRGTVFQAADLIDQGLVDEPAHPNQWGPRFGKAARDGVIEPAGYTPSKRATVHASICKQWRGTPTYRQQAGAA